LPGGANRLGYMTNPARTGRRDNACQRPPGDYSAPARKNALPARGAAEGWPSG
jgi:hypothetical protein